MLATISPDRPLQIEGTMLRTRLLRICALQKLRHWTISTPSSQLDGTCPQALWSWYTSVSVAPPTNVPGADQAKYVPAIFETGDSVDMSLAIASTHQKSDTESTCPGVVGILQENVLRQVVFYKHSHTGKTTFSVHVSYCQNSAYKKRNLSRERLCCPHASSCEQRSTLTWRVVRVVLPRLWAMFAAWAERPIVKERLRLHGLVSTTCTSSMSCVRLALLNGGYQKSQKQTEWLLCARKKNMSMTASVQENARLLTFGCASCRSLRSKQAMIQCPNDFMCHPCLFDGLLY